MPEIRLLGSNSEGGERKQVVPNAKIDELRREKEENNAIFAAAAGAAKLTAGLVEQSRKRKDAIDIAAAEGEFAALENEVQSNHLTRMEEQVDRFNEDDDGFFREAERDMEVGLDAIKRDKSPAAQARIDELVARRGPVYFQDRAAEALAAREQFDIDRGTGTVTILLNAAAERGDLNAAIRAHNIGASMDLGERGNQLMDNLTTTALTSMIGTQLSNPQTTIDTAEQILMGDTLRGLDGTLQLQIKNQAKAAVRGVWQASDGPYSPASLQLAQQQVGETPHALEDLAEDAAQDLEFSRQFMSPLEVAHAESAVEQINQAKTLQHFAEGIKSQLADGTLPNTLSPADPSHVMAASLHFHDVLEGVPDMTPAQAASSLNRVATSGIIPPVTTSSIDTS